VEVMGLDRNNNTKVVNHLAISSVKNSKLSNFFIVFTIALSVSLLMVMSLYTIGFEKSQQRQVANMQHVIYQQVTEEQIGELAKDKRVDLLMLNKSGHGVEVKNKMLQPVWYDENAIKGDSSDVEGIKISDGKVPKAINEIAVSKGYCEAIGKKAKPGIEISLSFLDGTTEEFIISGILDMADKTTIYPVLFSESYAMKGAQLKNILCDAIVRIYDANRMSQSEFLEEIRDIAIKSGIQRKQVNENNYFLDTLSGGDRQTQQIVAMIALGIGILLVSILVIYSVFYLSVIGRIHQFGQLRTIGMTKKQIKRMITREGLMLSAMGIPIGLLVGGSIGYLIQKNGWDLKNTCIIAGIVMIADVITVLISIHKPAKIAAMISPIEAAKYSGYDDKRGKPTTKQLHRKLTPLSLAKMSATRNRKKTVLTMISLGVGGVLFMLATTFISSASLEEYSRQGEFQFGEFHISMSYNAAATAEHGLTDLQLDNPFKPELKAKIKAIDGVKKVTAFGKAAMRWEAHGEMEEDSINGFARGEIPEKLLESGSLDYDKLVENDEILICGNSIIEEIFGWKYALGDKVKFTVYNGTKEVEKEYTVAGFVDHRYFSINPVASSYLMPEDSLKRIMKDMNLTTELMVATEKANQKQVEAQLQNIIDGNPLLTMDTLVERQAVDEATFTMIFGMILGLSIFIIGFSMINLVNTLITSVVTRKQEFAMLQSIGMTNGQLMKMIQAEGLLLSLGNLAITLIAGIPVSYAGIELLRYFSADYMHFTFPVWFFLGYVVLILIVPMVVSAVTLQSFKKLSLVERLRIVD
jgi:putative ABC transport system permease protein